MMIFTFVIFVVSKLKQHMPSVSRVSERFLTGDRPHQGCDCLSFELVERSVSVTGGQGRQGSQLRQLPGAALPTGESPLS